MFHIQYARRRIGSLSDVDTITDLTVSTEKITGLTCARSPKRRVSLSVAKRKVSSSDDLLGLHQCIY